CQARSANGRRLPYLRRMQLRRECGHRPAIFRLRRGLLVIERGSECGVTIPPPAGINLSESAMLFRGAAGAGSGTRLALEVDHDGRFDERVDGHAVEAVLGTTRSPFVTAPIGNNAPRLRANGMSDSHFASRFVSRDDRAARGAARRRPRHDSAMEQIAEELVALRPIGWISRGVVRAYVPRREGGVSANEARSEERRVGKGGRSRWP